MKQEDGSWKKHSVPAQTVEQVLMGNPQVTGDALVYALELECPFTIFQCLAKFRQCSPRILYWSIVRAVCSLSRYRRLALVKAIITAKIHNQHAVPIGMG